MALTKARKGEAGPGLASRPFSASAGAAVLVTSLVIVPYVLKRLHELVPTAVATMHWRSPITAPGQLLLWEAFVTDQRKNTPTRHVEDAQLAIADFRRGMADPTLFESSVTAPECLSLLGAALLRTGWSTDVALLSTPCLVVRSTMPHPRWAGEAGDIKLMKAGTLIQVDHLSAEEKADNAKHDEMLRLARESPDEYLARFVDDSEK